MKNPLSTHDVVLDHVAVATNDLEASIKFYELLGLKFKPHQEEVPSQKVLTAFAPLTQDETGPMLELLLPTSEDSTIYQFIQKKGPGIHHLSFKTPDIKALMEKLKSQGMKLIYDEPRPGAHETIVNFIHPSSTGGVLVEIAQSLK